MLPIIDLSTNEGQAALDERIERLRQASSAAGKWAKIADEIIAKVQANGDAAIVEEMQKWTDPDFTADRIKVDVADLEAAEASMEPTLKVTIQKAIDNVRTYQQHVMPPAVDPVVIDGAELGLRFSPVDSAGLAVPGGSAVLFSSVIMLAVPALVAGVPADQIAVINPPPYRKAGEPAKDISPIVLGTCNMLGLKTVYRIGGPAGVAALAYGTETVRPVDLIAGPGHPVVAAAQGQVRGIVGTGDFYGSSEIVTVADESASVGRVASDLLAQAEHNPGKCFLVSWSAAVIEAIKAEVAERLKTLQRREPLEKSLVEESFAVLVNDEQQAIEVANRLAPEHMNLAVANPEVIVKEIRHAGEIFLGDQTPVACGDYWAGPSHTLPTDTTARFASGVSVYTFLKRTGTVYYREGMSQATMDAVALLAETEGLDAHAQSVRERGE